MSRGTTPPIRTDAGCVLEQVLEGSCQAWPIPPVDRLWGYSRGPGRGARAGWAVVKHSRDLGRSYLPNS